MKNFNIGNTDMRPNAEVPDGFLFIDTTINKLCYSQNNIWYDSLGNIANLSRSGPFSDKPTPSNVGFQYFNTDTHKMITWDGSKWWNPDGTEATS